MIRLYLDSCVVIDMLKAENGIKLKNDRKELAVKNLKNLKKFCSRYMITIPAIAVGEIINYINNEVDDERKKWECLRWFFNFINDYNIDILPVVYDRCLFEYQYSNNCVFSVAKEIMSRENPNSDECYGGRSLEGDDALILSQAILDENSEAIILTIDTRMLEASTPHDIIEEKGLEKKLRIISDLDEL